LFTHPLAIDPGAIRTPIPYPPHAFHPLDLGMLAGGDRFGEDHITGRRATDNNDSIRIKYEVYAREPPHSHQLGHIPHGLKGGGGTELMALGGGFWAGVKTEMKAVNGEFVAIAEDLPVDPLAPIPSAIAAATILNPDAFMINM